MLIHPSEPFGIHYVNVKHASPFYLYCLWLTVYPQASSASMHRRVNLESAIMSDELVHKEAFASTILPSNAENCYLVAST